MIRILTFVFFAAALLYQNEIKAQRISNVEWTLDEASDKIYVTYDLNKDGDKGYFDVSMKVVINGKTISPKATTVAGDIGRFQRFGKSKKIAWDIREYADQLEGASVQFQIIALSDGDTKVSNGNPVQINKPKSLPIYAGFGAVATTGLGLVIGGLKSKSNTKGDYDKIISEIMSNSMTDSEKQSLINAAFDESNPKYRKSQGLFYGGVGVFAVSAGVIIYRVIWNKKLQQNYSGIYPLINTNLANLTPGSARLPGFNVTFGLGLRTNF